MSTEDHRALRELLGPLALDHLSAAEEAQVRSHLDGCPSCRDELANLLPVVRQLGLLSDSPADAAGADLLDGQSGGSDGQPGPSVMRFPPAGLDDRISAAIEAERAASRRRWYTRTGAIAATAALAAAVVSALVVITLRPAEPTLEHVAVTVETSGVTADADLVAHTWGTEIKLNATGLVVGATYRVAIVTGAGDERSAGEFVGTGARPLHCNLNSAVLRPDAAGFVVLDDTGHEVLISTFA